MLTPRLSKSHVGEWGFFVSAPSQLLRREQTRAAEAAATTTVNIYSPGWITLHYNNIPCVPACHYIRKRWGGERISERWGEEGGLEDELCSSSDKRWAEETAGGSPAIGLTVDGVRSSGCNFSLQCVGGMTVWELLAHVEESCECRNNIWLNGCIEGMGINCI